jgi:integrase
MTAQWVERKTAIANQREDWFDTKVTGLGLRVSPSGKKVWFVMYRLRGESRKRRHTLEPYPALSLGDARARAQEVIVAASRGIDRGAQKVEEKRAPTFEDLALEYIERYAKGKGDEPNKRTWRRDEAMLRKQVIPHWGRRKVHEITRKDVVELLDHLQDRGLTTGANRVFAVVRKVFNWAISRDIVQASPCYQVKPPAREHQRDRVLADAEIQAVWTAFDGLTPLMARAFKLFLLTAQRRGEVLSMRWQDLDLDAGWWTIPAGQSKNKLSHRVPLSPMAIALIRELRELEDHETWVFPCPRKATGKHIENIQKCANQVKQESGVAFVVHDLRRTAASNMTSIGVSRLVVSKLLNHVEPGVTRVYDRHAYDREKRTALLRWASHLARVLDSKEAKPMAAPREPGAGDRRKRRLALARAGRQHPGLAATS